MMITKQTYLISSVVFGLSFLMQAAQASGVQRGGWIKITKAEQMEQFAGGLVVYRISKNKEKSCESYKKLDEYSNGFTFAEEPNEFFGYVFQKPEIGVGKFFRLLPLVQRGKCYREPSRDIGPWFLYNNEFSVRALNSDLAKDRDALKDIQDALYWDQEAWFCLDHYCDKNDFNSAEERLLCAEMNEYMLEVVHEC